MSVCLPDSMPEWVVQFICWTAAESWLPHFSNQHPVMAYSIYNWNRSTLWWVACFFFFFFFSFAFKQIRQTFIWPSISTFTCALKLWFYSDKVIHHNQAEIITNWQPSTRSTQIQVIEVHLLNFHNITCPGFVIKKVIFKFYEEYKQIFLYYWEVTPLLCNQVLKLGHKRSYAQTMMSAISEISLPNLD